MELLALWEVLRRRWWLILIPVGVVIIVTLPALPSLLASSSSYSVAIRFTAAAPSDAALIATSSYEDSVYVPWLASEYVVVNLPQWVTSDSFAQEVSANLAAQGIQIPYEDVRSAFMADSARSILVVYITWADRTEIEAIAASAIQVLQTRNEAYFPQFAAYPAQVQALDEIRVNTLAPALMSRLSPFLRVGIGLVAGVGLAILAEYFDQTVRKREDLTALGLDVLGILPTE